MRSRIKIGLPNAREHFRFMHIFRCSFSALPFGSTALRVFHPSFVLSWFGSFFFLSFIWIHSNQRFRSRFGVLRTDSENVARLHSFETKRAEGEFVFFLFINYEQIFEMSFDCELVRGLEPTDRKDISTIALFTCLVFSVRISLFFPLSFLISRVPFSLR